MLPNARALAHFKKVDTTMYQLARVYGKYISTPHYAKTNQALFESLCESVVSQQLSVKAADTIWGRLKEICGGRVTPAHILKTRLPRLRTAGLSAAKAKTLKEIAKTVTKGLVLTKLRGAPSASAYQALLRIWGVGPWTTEMFLIFALGHEDIFSARDLGLMRSMETLYGIPKDSRKEVYESYAALWSPHRSYASRLLWKARDIGPVVKR